MTFRTYRVLYLYGSRDGVVKDITHVGDRPPDEIQVAALHGQESRVETYHYVKTVVDRHRGELAIYTLPEKKEWISWYISWVERGIEVLQRAEIYVNRDWVELMRLMGPGSEDNSQTPPGNYAGYATPSFRRLIIPTPTTPDSHTCHNLIDEEIAAWEEILNQAKTKPSRNLGNARPN